MMRFAVEMRNPTMWERKTVLVELTPEQVTCVKASGPTSEWVANGWACFQGGGARGRGLRLLGWANHGHAMNSALNTWMDEVRAVPALAFVADEMEGVRRRCWRKATLTATPLSSATR